MGEVFINNILSIIMESTSDYRRARYLYNNNLLLIIIESDGHFLLIIRELDTCTVIIFS